MTIAFELLLKYIWLLAYIYSEKTIEGYLDSNI